MIKLSGDKLLSPFLLMDKLFFDILQVAVGRRRCLDAAPSVSEWNHIYRMAVKHSLAGICASAVDLLPESQRPPRPVAVKLAVMAAKIEQTNILVSRRASDVSGLFASGGLRSCVLKGQGMAVLYPRPMRRQSGDIDLWVEGGFENVCGFVHRYFPDAKARYHHIDFHVFDDVAVEVHFRPSWMFSPFSNRMLMRWFDANHSWDNVPCAGGYNVPDIHFNSVYIPIHIFRHLFDEGIGLRQVMDYYYVVSSLPGGRMKEDNIRFLRRVGLYRFVCGMMYVLHEVFGLTDSEMPLPQDAVAGRFLLDDIVTAGNFGRFDPRVPAHKSASPLAVFMRKQRRALRMSAYFPGEVLWGLYFHVYQRFWRLKRGYL